MTLRQDAAVIAATVAVAGPLVGGMMRYGIPGFRTPRAVLDTEIQRILDLGVKAGLVEKSGAWFSYDSIRIGQGRENAKTFLKQNPAIAQDIEERIRTANGLDFSISGEEAAVLDD